MSVATISSVEYGTLIAIAVRHFGENFNAVLDLCELAAQGNQAAFFAQYGELEPLQTREDIEAEALRLLADKASPLTGSFGPVLYNNATNDGVCYWGFLPVAEQRDGWESLKVIEKKCNKWQEAERRRIEREEENAKAYAEVPKLETRTALELCEVCGGADRYIVACYGVDESDCYTDYYGGRTVRTVVIGFAKGKKESFKQLREAASLFPPTASMGVGRDRWTARAVWDHNSYDEAAKAESQYNDTGRYCKGEYIQWLRTSESPVFATEAELDAWIAANPLGKGAEYTKGNRDPEHRENYSMGGGNYLGWSRYGGWSVYSMPIEHLRDAYEFYTPTEADFERLAQHKAEVPKKTRTAKAYPLWTAKGLLANADYPDSSRAFRKLETVEAEAAKLRGLGHNVEIVGYRGYRYEYRIKRVDVLPVAVESATPATPATPQQLDAATPQQLDAATPQQLDAATPQQLDSEPIEAELRLYAWL